MVWHSTCHVADCIVGQVVIAIDKHLELADTDAQIGLIEAVGDVEAERPKLATLLDEGVKEAEAVKEALEGQVLAMLNIVKEAHVTDGVVEVGAEQVHAQTSWRFIGHFDAVLEHRDRELGRGIAG